MQFRMWAWLSTAKNYLTKFSVTAMLRERLALAEAEIAKLKEENAALKAQLENERVAHHQTKEELQRLQKEHEEQISLHDSGVEFRRGKRTRGEWMPFCPKCHIVLNPWGDSGWQTVNCPAGCGWVSSVTKREICEILNQNNNPDSTE